MLKFFLLLFGAERRKLSYEWRLHVNVHRQPHTGRYVPQSETPVTMQVLDMHDLCGQAPV